MTIGPGQSSSGAAPSKVAEAAAEGSPEDDVVAVEPRAVATGSADLPDDLAEGGEEEAPENDEVQNVD